MGQRVLRLLDNHPILRLGVVLARAGGTPLPPELPVEHDVEAALARADVVVDFSAPAACSVIGPRCAALGIPYVVASTGLSTAEDKALNQVAKGVAVLQAANLSLGVNVMLELVELAASRLKDYDMEISEIHHRHKRDAPSGTALALGGAAQRGAGKRREVLGRQGITEPRADDELGYAAMRGGEVAGEHTVYFFGEAERLEITHRSNNADIFAAGALRAAAWLLGKPAGRYSMLDVLR